MIDTAMILAAGFGTRMRPITEHMPKPLIPLCGRSLIDHGIDRLVAAGVKRVVVNTHYKAPMMAEHLKQRQDVEIVLSHEETLLDTGGGVKNALKHLGEAFFVVNADVFWLNARTPALLRLANAWDPARLDALLLVQRTTSAVGYDGHRRFRGRCAGPCAAPRRARGRALSLRRHRDFEPPLLRGRARRRVLAQSAVEQGDRRRPARGDHP